MKIGFGRGDEKKSEVPVLNPPKILRRRVESINQDAASLLIGITSIQQMFLECIGDTDSSSQYDVLSKSCRAIADHAQEVSMHLRALSSYVDHAIGEAET